MSWSEFFVMADALFIFWQQECILLLMLLSLATLSFCVHGLGPFVMCSCYTHLYLIECVGFMLVQGICHLLIMSLVSGLEERKH